MTIFTIIKDSVGFNLIETCLEDMNDTIYCTGKKIILNNSLNHLAQCPDQSNNNNVS